MAVVMMVMLNDLQCLKLLPCDGTKRSGSGSYMCIFINIVEIHAWGTFDPYDKFFIHIKNVNQFVKFYIVLNSSICVDSILVVNFIFTDSFSSMNIISYVSSLSPYGQLSPPPPLCGFPSMGN